MRMLARRDTVPAPYVVQSTGVFEGDDGQWSTFAVQIGTPPQSVRLLPGTSSSQVTVPLVSGCTGILDVLDDCGNLRGIDNNTSRGFVRDASTSWTYTGTYQLLPQQNVIKDFGIYGTDTVQIGRGDNTAHNTSVTRQTVAGINQIPFWLGSIGLGADATNISSISSPSLLHTLKNQSIIPSISYGYTAGQSYNKRHGSLVLGGFDQAKLGDDTVTFGIDTTTAPRRLMLDVQGIIAKGVTPGSQTGFLDGQITVSIDTSVSQMWLPSSVCDKIANTFGLIEDKSKGFFLLNDTMHSTLMSANPSLTFTVGGQRGGGLTNIEMKYSALDMEVGIPLYNSSVRYFPIARAANDSQLTFGRAFMQEAYLRVKWEEDQFTIGPVKSTDQTSIVAIQTPPQSSNSASTSSPSSISTPSPQPSGLGVGAIVCIVIPLVLVIAAIGGLVFFLRRRHRQRQQKHHQSYESQPPEYDPSGGSYYYTKHGNMSQVKTPGTEISEMFDSSKPRAELTSDNVRKFEEMASERELMSTPIMELEGDRAESELDSSVNADRTSGLSGVISPLRQSVTSPPPERVRSPLSNHSVYEME